MKYCPVCQTRYDEEIMRFCTKDGTPLIDEEAPNFTEMPSEDSESSEDDFGAETVIRRKPAESEITNVEPRAGETSQRMVIPTSEHDAGRTAASPRKTGFVSAAAAEKNKHGGSRAFDGSRNNHRAGRRSWEFTG